MSDLTAAWGRLKAAAAEAQGRRIASLFDAEPERLDRLTVAAAGLELELSKQPWSLSDLEVCLDLAKAADVEAARTRFFAGEPVNSSEHRAALHMALRAPRGSDFKADGEPVSAAVDAMRERMASFARAIRSGAHKGATGKPFRKLVHIGIGGSDFGPRLVWEALRPVAPRIELRFVANVDPAEIALALEGLDPAQTLV
ncbi:MAG: glucose-6-phosphate isomerase, partial [Phenylobacterium sp.]